MKNITKKNTELIHKSDVHPPEKHRSSNKSKVEVTGQERRDIPQVALSEFPTSLKELSEDLGKIEKIHPQAAKKVRHTVQQLSEAELDQLAQGGMEHLDPVVRRLVAFEAIRRKIDVKVVATGFQDAFEKILHSGHWSEDEAQKALQKLSSKQAPEAMKFETLGITEQNPAQIAWMSSATKYREGDYLDSGAVQVARYPGKEKSSYSVFLGSDSKSRNNEIQVFVRIEQEGEFRQANRLYLEEVDSSQLEAIRDALQTKLDDRGKVSEAWQAVEDKDSRDEVTEGLQEVLKRVQQAIDKRVAMAEKIVAAKKHLTEMLQGLEGAIAWVDTPDVDLAELGPLWSLPAPKSDHKGGSTPGKSFFKNLKRVFHRRS